MLILTTEHYAILLMHGRLRRLVSHKKVAFIAVGLIGFIGRFILNL